MMLLGDRKKIAQLIISENHQAPKEKDVPQGLEADFSKAHESAMSEFMQALEQGEPGKASLALKQFIKFCIKEDEYSEPEEE
jgi:hypothetical protein